MLQWGVLGRRLRRVRRDGSVLQLERDVLQRNLHEVPV
jgi:hypothetical protein